jgi:hypothetical protein
MNDLVLVAAIASVAPTLTSLGALIVALRNGRKTDEIKKATDGLTRQLVDTTRSDALQEGHKEGVAHEKADAMLIAENGIRNEKAAKAIKDFVEKRKN